MKTSYTVNKLINCIVAADGERAGCDDNPESRRKWVRQAINKKQWREISYAIAYGVPTYNPLGHLMTDTTEP